MSKRKSMMCLLIVMICSLFISVFAPVARAAEKEPVTLYIFHGSTCPHCQEAMTFFKKLLKTDEFKDILQVRAIEIWGSEENSQLANKACEAMGDEPINGSVPYIVVGDKTFGGYSSSSDASIKTAIKDAYDNNKEDKIKSIVGNAGELLVGEESGSTVTTTIIVLVIAAGIIGSTIYFARGEEDTEEETTKEVKETKDEEKKEEKVAENKEQGKTNTTQAKKTTTKKKSSSNKKNTKKTK